jgi:hypothetical protein
MAMLAVCGIGFRASGPADIVGNQLQGILFHPAYAVLGGEARSQITRDAILFG